MILGFRESVITFYLCELHLWFPVHLTFISPLFCVLGSGCQLLSGNEGNIKRSRKKAEGLRMRQRNLLSGYLPAGLCFIDICPYNPPSRPHQQFLFFPSCLTWQQNSLVGIPAVLKYLVLDSLSSAHLFAKEKNPILLLNFLQ